MKSAFLVVKVDQGIEGTMRIDFDGPSTTPPRSPATLILNLLEDLGAELPEMKTWTLSFDQEDRRRDERAACRWSRCARS